MSQVSEDPAPPVAPSKLHRLAIIGLILLAAGGALFLTVVLLAPPGHLPEWGQRSMLAAATALIVSGVASLIGSRLDRRHTTLVCGHAKLRQEVGRLTEAMMRHMTATVAETPRQRQGRADDDGMLVNGSSSRVDAELKAYLAGRMDGEQSLPPHDSTGWSR